MTKTLYMPLAPQKVHYQTGGRMIANTSYSSDNQGSKLLSQEKGSDQNHIGIPCKTQMRDKSKCNNNYHR
jgi:hypothetical protein